MVEHECFQEGRLKNIERKVDRLIEEDTEQKIFATRLEMSLQQVIKSNENIEKYIRDSQVTFQKINENLDKLNAKTESQDNKLEEVTNKVDKLSEDFKKAEEKNLVVVDQRDWMNKLFRKVVLPVGGFAGSIFAIYEILKLFGVFDK